MGDTTPDVIIETDINSGGSIFDGNGDAISTGMNIDAGVGGDLFFYTRGGIGSDSSGDNEDSLEIDAETVAFLNRAGDVNLHDLDSDGDGLRVIKNSITGVTFTLAFAREDICLLVDNGDLTLSANTTAGGDVALEAGGAVNLNGRISSGGSVGIQARGGAIVDGRGSGINISGSTDVALVAAGSIGTSSDSLRIDADTLAVQATGEVNIEDATGDLEIVSFSTGASPLKSGDGVSGVTATGDVQLTTVGDLTVGENIVSGGDLAIYTSGNIQLGDTTGTTRGVLVAGVGADGAIGGMDDATATVSLEAGGDITDGNGDSTADGDADGFADGANIIALGNGSTDTGGNVVLKAASAGKNDPIEIDTLVVAASTSYENVELSEQDLVTGDGLTVGELVTTLGAETVTGLTSAGGGLSIGLVVAAGDLRVNEDINGDGGSVYLSAAGDITVGDDPAAVGTDADQVLGGAYVVLDAGNDIIDNNGVGNFAVNALDVGLRAGGSVGSVQFDAGSAASGTAFELGKNSILAAEVGEDLNVSKESPLLVDFSLNYEDLTGASYNLTGITAGQDVCLATTSDVAVSTPIVSTGGSVGLQAGSGIVINADVSAADTISLETAAEIANPLGDLTAPNVVLDAATGIGTSSKPLQVKASNLAAENSTSGDIYIDAGNPSGSDVTVSELSALKSGNTITGVSGAEDVNILVDTDNLQVSDDVSSQSGTVYLKADGSITVGDDAAAVGTAADQITGPGKVILEAGGDIVDNNGVGNVAIDAGPGTTDGKVGLVAGGSVGDVQFNAGAAATGSAFEIGGIAVGAQVTGEINISTADSYVSSTQIAYTDSTGATVYLNGLNAGEDLCLDATNGIVNLSMGLASTNGSVAVRAGSDVVLSYGGITAADTISVESGGEIRDDSGGSQSLTAPNVVLDAAHGIGDGFHVLEVNAANLAAANSTDGNIKIEATNPAGSDLSITELSTLKSGNAITGVRGAEDIEIDVDTDNLLVNENIVSGADLALRADGDIQLGDTTGTTRGVLVAGVGADGVIGGMDDVTATVSLESNGSITDGNGDSTVDGDGDGFADGANIIALGDGTVDSGGNIVLQGTSVGTMDLIEIDALTLAASAEGLGITEQDLVSDDGLTVGALTTTKGALALTGLTVDGLDLFLEVAKGDLRINEDVSISSSSPAYLSAAGDITVGNDAAATGADADQISAVSSVVLIAGNDIVDNNGEGNPAVQSDHVILEAGGSIGEIQFASGAAATESPFEVQGNTLAAEAGDDIDISATAAFLRIVSDIYFDPSGGLHSLAGVTAGQDLALEVTNGSLFGSDSITAQTGSVSLKAAGDLTLVFDVSAADSISLETDGKIDDLLSGSGSLNAPNVVLLAAEGIGSTSRPLEINTSNLAADNTTSGDIYIDAASASGTDVTITELSALKSGTTVTGVSGTEDVVLDVTGNLNVHQDVTSSGGDVALRSSGTLTIGDGSGGTTDSDTESVTADGSTVSLEAASIVDANGTGGPASVTADTLVIETTSGVGSSSDSLTVDVDSMAARVRGLQGLFVQDVSGDLTIGSGTTLIGGTALTGVISTGGVCIDVLAGDLILAEAVSGSSGTVALRADGDIDFNNGNSRISAPFDISLESLNGGITNTVHDGTADLSFGVDTGSLAISVDGAVGSAAAPLEVETGELAVSAGEDVFVEDLTGDLAVTELTAQKSGDTISGVSAGGDVGLSTVGALQLNADVVGGTVGAASEVALKAEGDITIGDGANGQVRNAGADSGNRVSLFSSSGDIVDNNGDGVAAVDANGGDVVASTSNGSIGTTDFAGTASTFEIEAARLAATSGDDINVLDLDTHADGLGITTLALANGGGDVTGLTAANDICIDVVNETLNVDQPITSTSGSVALRTQDADGNDDADIVLNGADVTAAAVGETVSLNSANEIIDTDSAAGSVIADNVVLLADTGIGNASEVNLDTTNIAARSTSSGNVNLSDGNISNTRAGFTLADLYTLKTNTLVSGISSAADILLDLTGDFVVGENIVSGGNLAIRATGDIQLGDTTGTTRGVLVAGVGADGAIGGGDDMTATVSLEAGGDITDGNGDDTTDGDGDGYADGANIIALGDGTVTGGNIVITADSIGGNDPIETDALVLAASSDDGNLRVAEQDLVTGDGLTIGELATALGSTALTGLSTNTSLLSAEVAGGDLRVNEDIAGNVTVFLSAAGDITVGDDSTAVGADADQIDGSNSVALFAGNDIVDNNGSGNSAVRSSQVVLVAGGSVGDVQFNAGAAATGSAFEIEADTLAADVTGALNVFDSKSLTTGAVTYYDSNGAAQPLDAVRAGEDLCLEAVGAVQVQSAVSSTNGSVALKASGDIALDASVSAADTISAEAGQKILSTSSGSLTATNVVLDATEDIGDSSSSIQVNASNLAAGNTSSGDISIEATNPGGGEVTVTELHALKSGNTVSGVSAADDVILDVTGGLQIQADVTALGGSVALKSSGALTIGDGQGGTDADDTESITADQTVSLEADSVTDANGSGGPASVVADTVVLDVTNAVGASVDDLTVEAVTLAGQAGTPGLYVQDLSGDLTIGSASTLVGGNALTGVSSAGDVCLDASAGDLVLAEAVTGTAGTVALRADGDIDFSNQNNRVSGSKISLESVNGTLVNTVHDGTADLVSDGSLVISAKESVGSSTSPLEVQTAEFAARTDGDLFVEDLSGDLALSELALEKSGGSVSGVSAGGDVDLSAVGALLDSNASGAAAVTASKVSLHGTSVTDSGGTGAFEIEATNLEAQASAGRADILDLDAAADGLNVNGVTATLDVGLDVVNGDLRINEDLTAGGSVALRTRGGDVVVGNGDGDVVTAQNGIVSVESAGDIVDDNGLGKAALLTDSNVVLTAGGEIAGTSGSLEIEADGLAASAGGDLKVDDLSGDLRVVEGSTLKTATALDGISAGGEVCLDVKAGNLDVANGIVSDDAVALQALGNVSLSGADNITVNDGGRETASLEAGGEISSPGTGIVEAGNVVLQAGAGIGSTDPVEIDADSFAASAGTGRVNVVDTGGGLRVSALSALKSGDPITGVTASQDVCLDIVGGDLVIDESIEAGTLVALKADGDIFTNAASTAPEKVSVESTGGSIMDGNGDADNFVGAQVGIKAGGNIGSKTDAVDIDSDLVAARSVTGELNLRETSGDLNLGDLELAKTGGTLNNLSVATDISLIADDGTVNYTGLTIQAPNEIAIRTRDTLVTDGVLQTEPGGRVSIEVTDGDITDPSQDGPAIRTGDAVLKASGNIGDRFQPLQLDVDRVAAQSENGHVSLNEKNGLTVTDLQLSLGGGTIPGISAAQDVDLMVANGDLDLGLISGKNVRVNVRNGSITDGNGPDDNVVASGDVQLDAYGEIGKDDPLEIRAGGTVVVNSQTSRSVVTGNSNTLSTPFITYSLLFQILPDLVLPPGVFAQDNVELGEKGFYLEQLYGYLTPQEVELILNRLSDDAKREPEPK